MRRFGTIMFLFIFPIMAQSQQRQEVVSFHVKKRFSENRLYIFCRGTKSKNGLIAHSFNISDTNITHVGIGFFESGGIKVYNVTDNSDKQKSALIIDSMESFVDSDDVYYFSIWELKINKSQIKKIKTFCNKSVQKRIYFDAAFNIQSNDTLYCSEYCAMALTSIRYFKNKLRPVSKTLNNSLYESILKRKELIYYPVDFFQQGMKFKKILEFKF